MRPGGNAGPPDLYGLFHRNIEGDEALLRLARRRFERAGIGAEIHPGSVDEADREWRLVPAMPARHFAHLPRHLDLLDPAHAGEVLRFALGLAGRARGLVVHDQDGWRARAVDLAGKLSRLDGRLREIPGAPAVHIEYAAGLPLDRFVEIAEGMRGLARIAPCIDTGHVTLFATRDRMRARFPELDVPGLAGDPRAAKAALPELERCMALAKGDLLEMVARLAALGRPLHFHVHDGHPLSTLSPYGVRDHLGFARPVPVAGAVDPAGSVPGLIGRDGLEAVARAALSRLPPGEVTFTLEIHHTVEGRRAPLGDDGDLFRHWTDTTNAELANAWLGDIVESAAILREACRRAVEAGQPS